MPEFFAVESKDGQLCSYLVTWDDELRQWEVGIGEENFTARDFASLMCTLCRRGMTIILKK